VQLFGVQRWCRALDLAVGWWLKSKGSDTKVVYRRYASLFFVTGISSGDNELATLEIIHRYVEVLDRYFGNVSGFPWSVKS
jgi:hypothetical protein